MSAESERESEKIGQFECSGERGERYFGWVSDARWNIFWGGDFKTLNFKF